MSRPSLCPCLLLALAACGRPTVVVVGGGVAGLSAAMDASGPARVILLEGSDHLGGMTLLGAAITAMPDETCLANWNAAAGTQNPARDRYARQVGPQVVDWLASQGLRWAPAPHGGQPGCTLVTPVGGGRALVETLARGIQQRKVEVRLDARVNAISREVPPFWQSGAGRLRVDTGTGSFTADAVILATGGFMGNAARVRQGLGLGDAPLLAGSPPAADGNGLDLARSMGGQERAPMVVELYAHSTPDPRDPTHPLMLLDTRRAWFVDGNGAPLPEARSPRGDTGRLLLDRAAGRGWVLADDEGFQALKFLDPWSGRFVRWPGAAAPASSDPGPVVASDLPGLAVAVGLPEDRLLAARDLPGTEPRPPFHALPLVPTTAKGLSGLETDLEGRVLGEGGAPVPGLYGAGELSAFGHPYDGAVLDSTMTSGAILTGRLTARAALSDLGLPTPSPAGQKDAER